MLRIIKRILSHYRPSDLLGWSEEGMKGEVLVMDVRICDWVIRGLNVCCKRQKYEATPSPYSSQWTLDVEPLLFNIGPAAQLVNCNIKKMYITVQNYFNQQY